MINFSCDKEWN